MGTRAQRGATLVETTVAAGIFATLAGAALSSTTMAAHAAGSVTNRRALQTLAEREMHVALDVLKYQGAALAAASVATAAPLPAGTPLPVTLSLNATPLASGGVAVAITVTSLADATQTATLSETIGARAPLPGSQIDAPGLAPAPTGAP